MNTLRALFIRMNLWWIERDIRFMQHQVELMREQIAADRHAVMNLSAKLNDLYMDRPC